MTSLKQDYNSCKGHTLIMSTILHDVIKKFTILSTDYILVMSTVLHDFIKTGL